MIYHKIERALAITKLQLLDITLEVENVGQKTYIYTETDQQLKLSDSNCIF